MRKISLIAWVALLACDEKNAGDPSGGNDSGAIAVIDASSVGVGDAGLLADGGGQGDAGSSDAGGENLYEAVVKRLRQCGVLSQEGRYNGEQQSFAFDKCLARCLLTAPCEEVKINVCATGLSNPIITKCIAQCANEYITCSDTLRGGKRCDGVKDCGDGSDEKECDFFTCKNGQRIRDLKRCDELPDCSDGSDETNCFGAVSCADGKEPIGGIALECNGSAECSDGSDEPDCMSRGLLFTCDDGVQLPISMVCNLEVDCKDKTDEMQGCATRECSRGIAAP